MTKDQLLNYIVELQQEVDKLNVLGNERKKAEEALGENLEQLSKKNRYEKIISTVTRSVHRSIDLGEVIENAVDAMNKHIETAENVSIYMVEGEDAVLKSYRGYPERLIKKLNRIPRPKGFTWKTIMSGKPLHCPDVDKDPYIGLKGKQLGTKSYVSMPICHSGKAIGCINVNSIKKYAFDNEELNLLEIVANQIENAVNNAKQAEALKDSEESLKRNVEILSKKSRYKEIISTVTRSVHSSLELDEVLENAVRAMHENIDYADNVGIFFVEDDYAVIKANRGYSKELLNKVKKIPRPKGFTWKTILEGKLIYCSDAEADSTIGPAGKKAGTKSYASMPIKLKDKTIACININSFQKHSFDNDDLKLLEIVARQIEVAINNATQAEALKKSEEKLLKNLDQLSKKNRFEEIISAVTRTVHKSLDLQEILENAVEAMSENIDVVNHVSIFLVEGTDAVMKVHRGYPDWFIEKIKRIPRPKGHTWNTILEGKTRYCPDLDKDTVIGPAGRQVGSKSYLSLPLRIKSNTIGCINVHSLNKDAFEEDDINLLEVVAKQIGIAIDKSKKAEALRNSEERYRALYDENPSMYFTISEEGNVLSVNQHGVEQLGYTVEELVGNSVLAVFHEEDQASVKEQLNICFENPGQIFKWEFRKVCKDQRVIWVNEIARCVWDADGNKVALIVCEDITEQKTAELEKREAEERYRALVENSYDLIIEISPDFKFLYVSPNHKSVLGYEQEELIGRSVIENIHPDDRQEVLSKFQRTGLNIINLLELNVDDILENNDFATVYTQEARELWGERENAIEKHLESDRSFLYRYKTKDGKWIWLESIGRPFWTSGNELRIAISSRDITERKKAEIQLIQSREQLRKLATRMQSIREEEITSLARWIHDDLGQLLTGLKIEISLMDKKLSSASNGGYSYPAKRMKSISGLIDTAIFRVQRISTELRSPVLDTLGLVEAIKYQSKEFESMSGIYCEVDIKTGGIAPDQKRSIAIFRVLQESLTNIARHANATRVGISMKLSGENLLLEVEDNGRGITNSEIVNPKSVGILGMEERVLVFGGDLKIRGIPKKGTIVSVILPLNNVNM
ncbi:MAG: GAF domain-containing protein [Thermodesulfobacteriota bacterium]